MAQLTNQELRNKTEEFRLRLAGGGVTLDGLLPEAFAVVREAAKRQLDMRHFDSQLVSDLSSLYVCVGGGGGMFATWSG